jgi:hypothetical protein
MIKREDYSLISNNRTNLYRPFLRSAVISDGAVIWHMTKLVTARAIRFTYGVAKQCVYQSTDKRHRGRPIIKRKGGNIIDGVWEPLIRKASEDQYFDRLVNNL